MRRFPLLIVGGLLAASLLVLPLPADKPNDPNEPMAHLPEPVPPSASESRQVDLAFQPYEDPEPHAVTRITSAGMHKLHAETTLPSGKLVLYEKQPGPAAPQLIYAAYRPNGEAFAYDVGPIAYDDRSANEVRVIASEALGTDSIRLDGACGANCPITRFLIVNQGVPSVWLNLHAHAAEVDLDGDSVTELVTSVGTLADTHILRMQQGMPVSVSLNKALDAIAVNFRQDTRTFEAFYRLKDRKPEVFRYEKERLHYAGEFRPPLP